ncbi:GNAT family N-acetyltransferase [Methanococcoides sp. SA1]|nr:GNAT family N-acetyltransferase [Methanococcoides sp. SA1]
MLTVSPKIKLRAPIISDLEEYYKHRNDELIIKNMSFMKDISSFEHAKKDLQTLIEQNKTQGYDYFVVEYENQFAGTIGLSKIEKQNKARIGYWMSKEFRGKKIMSRTINSTCQYGFNNYNLKFIYARVAIFNKASIKVLENNNFRLDRTIKDNRKTGKDYFDELIFSKYKD